MPTDSDVNHSAITFWSHGPSGSPEVAMLRQAPLGLWPHRVTCPRQALTAPPPSGVSAFLSLLPQCLSMCHHPRLEFLSCSLLHPQALGSARYLLMKCPQLNELSGMAIPLNQRPKPPFFFFFFKEKTKPPGFSPRDQLPMQSLSLSLTFSRPLISVHQQRRGAQESECCYLRDKSQRAGEGSPVCSW